MSSYKLAPERKTKTKKTIPYILTLLRDQWKAADTVFKTDPSPSNKSKFLAVQEQLLIFYLQDYKRSLTKLKVSFYLQGEKPGKILANRVKTHRAKSKISHFNTLNGNKIFDPRIIANTFADYYYYYYFPQSLNQRSILF